MEQFKSGLLVWVMIRATTLPPPSNKASTSSYDFHHSLLTKKTQWLGLGVSFGGFGVCLTRHFGLYYFSIIGLLKFKVFKP